MLADTSPRHLAIPRCGPAQPFVQEGARAFPIRPGCMQGRLGAQRPSPLGSSRLPEGWHGPRGRDAGRGGHERVRGGGGPARGTALLPRRPARCRRRHACSRGQTNPVGLLPRAVGIDSGHDRADRGANRALCARLSGPHPGPGDQDGGTGGGGKPQLRRRRYHGGHGHFAPNPLPADPALGQLQDLRTWLVPLLRLDAPRRRRPRHVRLLGRQKCAEGSWAKMPERVLLVVPASPTATSTHPSETPALTLGDGLPADLPYGS